MKTSDTLSPPTNRRVVLAAALAGLLLTGGGIAAYSARADVPAAPAAAQAAQVDTAEVIHRAITDWQDFSGRLEAVDRVEIRPQVSGILTQVHFKDGAAVRKGDVLFTIDPRPSSCRVLHLWVSSRVLGHSLAWRSESVWLATQCGQLVAGQHWPR